MQVVEQLGLRETHPKLQVLATPLAELAALAAFLALHTTYTNIHTRTMDGLNADTAST